MRVLVLLLFMVGLDLYAWQSLRHLSESWPGGVKTAVTVTYWVLSACSLAFVALSLFVGDLPLGRAALTIIRAIIFILYLSKFIASAFLLIDDIRRAFGFLIGKITGSPPFDPGRARFLSATAAIAGALPLTAMSYGILRNPYRYKTFRTEPLIDGLPGDLDGLKVIQISDIHSGSFFFKEPIKRAIELINREEPDLVFFTGDLVNSKAEEMEPYIDIFSGIESRYGTFSVRGNHDYGDYHRWPDAASKAANTARFEEIHRELGWDLLSNENRLLSIRGQEVAVIGIENMSAIARFPKYGDLQKAREGTDKASLRLLLSHDPSYWKTICNEFPDIDITFSGHTHGFQFGVEIPGIFKWSPSQYMYPQWAGLYTQGTQHLYVNRGLGFLGYPGRVGILPEVTSMTIRGSIS
jgi:predicted MPP superfamily phosphohydrolase